MKTIRWFDEIASADIDLVGGKGANLGEMSRAGMPVPPGFCLIAEAYRDFIANSSLGQTIRETLEGVHPEDSAALELATEKIRSLIIHAPMPAEAAGEIIESYRQLNQRMARQGEEYTPVAVRSSATAEDLPDASFAGQQDTYLNIRGEKALLEHVKACWASLWTARATDYRSRHGFDHSKVYLAVVVQAMIASEVSGILFTANPVDGDRQVAVINASWGLGEAIVSGMVTPDTIRVHKERREVLNYQTASKDCLVHYAADGGVETKETAAEDRQKPALSEAQAIELVELGVRIESHYGAPQDIEWAYAGGRWFVLQVRPVTTLKTASAPAGPEYYRTMFIEIFPDPLTPVFYSVMQAFFKSMLDYTFHIWGLKAPEGTPAVSIFYNQPYFNREYIERAFAPFSPQVREMLVAQIINPFRDQTGGTQLELSWPFLRLAGSTLQFMITFPKKLPVVLERYHHEVTRVEAMQVGQLSDQEIVATIKNMVFNYTRRLVDYDFLMIAVVKRVYHLLGQMLEPYFGDEADAIRGKLISGVTGNLTMESNLRLWELAQTAKASPTVSEAIRQAMLDPSGVAVLLNKLEETPAAKTFLDEYKGFIQLFGHREVRLEIIYPTWCEDPTPVFNFIRGYLDLGEGQNPHRQQQRLIQQRQELVAIVRQRVRQDLKGRLLIWPLFHWLLKNIEFHTRQRDTVHFEMTRILPPFRRFFHELGTRWTAAGVLQEPEQIYYLTFDEIEATADQPNPIGITAQQRQEEFQRNKQRAWPDIIRGGQEIYARGTEDGEGEAGQLAGIPGSPGVASGTARVICKPEEFWRLQKGDILVAPITNPVWTPLFAIAGGVITEVGGILSHGAIVAREYGIPAVMSVREATQKIKDGQAIRLDGDRGLVHIV